MIDYYYLFALKCANWIAQNKSATWKNVFCFWMYRRRFFGSFWRHANFSATDEKSHVSAFCDKIFGMWHNLQVICYLQFISGKSVTWFFDIFLIRAKNRRNHHSMKTISRDDGRWTLYNLPTSGWMLIWRRKISANTT